MIVLPVPSLLSPPVLAELVQANLVTSEECRGRRDPSKVVKVQSGKSPEVLTKTADVLLRHGFEKESNLLAGKQTQPTSTLFRGAITVDMFYPVVSFWHL